MDKGALLEQARQMIRAEGEVIIEIAEQLGDTFIETVQLVSSCTGHILVTGAGTSGSIARRMIHLLATCGMPAADIVAWL